MMSSQLLLWLTCGLREDWGGGGFSFEGMARGRFFARCGSGLFRNRAALA